MFKNIRYYIVVIVLLLLGAFMLNKLLNNYNQLEQQKIDDQLSKMHNDAIINAKAGIEIYASLVSSLKSYTKNTSDFPTEVQLQGFLNDFLKEIEFNDSIVVNYIDSTHVFKYVITPTQIDAPNLKGVSVKEIKPQEAIDKLDDLMTTEDIRLFTPINLREGWTGFPFNFSAVNNKKEVLGYVTPIINVKYLLNFFYENNNEDLYVHKFLINDSLDLTRETFYDNSPVYNKAKDGEYYKNFNVDKDNFIFSTIELFGLKLKVGSAFKRQPVVDQTMSTIAYLWYLFISSLILVILHQFLKNKVLSKNLKVANTKLEKSLFKIQTLIKEVHHRVKNNMQMISGLLLMQEDEYEDEKIKAALRQSQNRIHSMSLVHEKLYGNNTLREIRLKEYIVQLIESVDNTIRDGDLSIDKRISVDEDLFFDADTTADLGLMINELVTNSFKHAFKANTSNFLEIEITKKDDNYELIYSDSGEGLPDNFNIETSESLGMKLLQILTEQLSGTLLYNKEVKSTFSIMFKPFKKRF